MTTSNIIPVKYIFLDVVQYTNRPIEAQCDVIKALSDIVRGATSRYKISNDSMIYIPTGDGICVALLGATLPLDIHITIALEILGSISLHNASMTDDRRKFEVRIGINQSEDNLVTDINGRTNVAGSGINNARRIMDLADSSQILVSRLVYEVLHQREEYLNAFVKFAAQVKHGYILEVYQFVQKGVIGLNANPPSSILGPPEPESKLTKLTAYYFAHSIKNEDFILNKAKEDLTNTCWLKLLLWFLAEDSRRISETTAYDVCYVGAIPYGCPDTIEEQLEWFRENVDIGVAERLNQVTLDNAISPLMQHNYFEEVSQDVGRNLVINSKGKEKLKRDWPEIWEGFGLSELSG